MAELALYDVERYAFACDLHRMRVSQLMRSEAPGGRLRAPADGQRTPEPPATSTAPGSRPPSMREGAEASTATASQAASRRRELAALDERAAERRG